MEIRNIIGGVIFALEGAKTIMEVVTATVAAKQSLRSADLSGADLRGADLSGADLSGADLSGADLRSAYLRSADLRSADLSGADLSDADLSGADLRSADLRSADLSGADLSGANLSGANLKGANLSGADLSGANLSGANLKGANLSDAGKIVTMRVFTGLYDYEVWAVLGEDGRRWVRMGCLFKTLEQWEEVGIRQSNPSEFPDDSSEKSEDRVRAFEFAKDAVLRMKQEVPRG
jgi:Pentapeptide repeats (8 copies)